jgi:hypothetical protein
MNRQNSLTAMHELRKRSASRNSWLQGSNEAMCSLHDYFMLSLNTYMFVTFVTCEQADSELTLYTCNQEVRGSNFGRNNGYPDRELLSHFSTVQYIC